MPYWILVTLTACGARSVEARAPGASAEVPVIEALAALRQSPFAPQRAADRPADPLVPAPDGAMSVVVGALHSDRDVELSGFQAEVERNAGHVQRCWEQRAAGLRVQEGVVVIHAQIDPGGAVVEQCLSEDTVQDPDLQRCVNDLIAMGRYPAGAAMDVTVPLRFSAPKG